MRGRRPTRTLPSPVGEEVRAELARLGSPSLGPGLTEIVAAWEGLVGAPIAANAWPARFTRDGTLVVHTSSSAWAFELTQLEEMLRTRLAELVAGRLKFVVGPLPEPGRETVPSQQEVIHSPGSAEREEAGKIAASIADPTLREAVARAAAASLARHARTNGSTAPSDRL
jgi:hypothetical protein